jgi:hypothetical protein
LGGRSGIVERGPVCYYAAYLDRVNVGFAALHMNTALGLTAAASGLGSGTFFVGYFLAEIPCNLLRYPPT